jgi:hypothetical protein
MGVGHESDVGPLTLEDFDEAVSRVQSPSLF